MVRIGLLIALVAVVALLAQGPIPQDPAYHAFADTRVVLGIANGLNVLSNVPFAIVGLFGLAIVARGSATTFADGWTRVPWAALFAGTALTAVGSSHYHLAPDDARLVWDRLPMTVAFMGLVAAVIAERVGVPAAKRAFVPLLAFGIASVAYWRATELQGVGDLRPYALAQFGSLVLVAVLVAVRPHPRPGRRALAAALVLYAVAKLLETADAEVLAVTGAVSGHALKHVVAAAAIGCLAVEIARRPRGGTPRSVHDPPA